MHYLDGTFDDPVFQNEVVSRPLEGQNITAWTETYCQLRANYTPLPFGSESARHARHYLVEESPPKPIGPENSPVVSYTRTFCQIPAAHSEYRIIAYTFPGVTGQRWVNGVYIWEKYGSYPPATLLRQATVRYTYYLGVPSLSLPTQVTYNGEPVDYCGTVYEEDEDGDWVSAGATDPFIRPSTYRVSEQAERWWGPIYRKESVTVSLGSAVSAALP
jgi:hypothetical protein